jgi:N-methylhydantoinase A/oxoprolinase/acetone carboxylase beta subunit
LCALGDLVAGFRNEFAQTLIRLTSEVGDASAILAELETRARAWMEAQGIAAEAQNIEFLADMRYRGQGYEIPVPWGEDLDERFNALHEQLYGFRNEFAQTLIRLTAEVGDAADIRAELEQRARTWMDAQGIPQEAQRIEILADMRYRGQGYEIPVPWGDDLEERFNELHEQLYGFRMPNTASEIVNLRAVGTGDRPQPELPEEEPVEAALQPGTHARSELHPGCIIPGPSIVTEFDSTTVILDGYVAEIDRYFNLLIRPEAS